MNSLKNFHIHGDNLDYEEINDVRYLMMLILNGYHKQINLDLVSMNNQVPCNHYTDYL
jgi:hypothetical protein